MPRKVIDNPVLNRVPKNDREQVQFMKELDNYVVSRFDELVGRAGLKQLPAQRVSGRGAQQDADPLTSDVSGSYADIDIAAHNIQLGEDVVYYNGGSILGLPQETTYYIYADDPDYQGGTVAYYATTDQQEIAAAEGRYFVGSIVTARDEPEGTITGVTKANPAVVTCANTFEDGDQVDISGIVGMTELNGNRYTIQNVTASDFELQGVDSSTYTAYISGGTATFVTQTSSGGGGGGGALVQPVL